MILFIDKELQRQTHDRHNGCYNGMGWTGTDSKPNTQLYMDVQTYSLHHVDAVVLMEMVRLAVITTCRHYRVLQPLPYNQPASGDVVDIDTPGVTAAGGTTTYRSLENHGGLSSFFTVGERCNRKIHRGLFVIQQNVSLYSYFMFILFVCMSLKPMAIYRMAIEKYRFLTQTTTSRPLC